MAANHLWPRCDISLSATPSAGTPAPAAVAALAGGLGVHERALRDDIEGVHLAEGVGQEGVWVGLAEDPAPGVGYALRDGGPYHLGHGDIGGGVMGGVAEDHLSLSALGGLNADLGVDLHQQGRVVKANAVRAGKVLEVEGGELLAAAGPGALDAPPQAPVADFVAFGAAPDVLALVLEYDLGQLLGLAVELASEDDGGVGGHRHRHTVVANDISITGANVDGGAEEGARAVRVADLAHPARPGRLRGRLQGRRQQGLHRLRRR